MRGGPGLCRDLAPATDVRVCVDSSSSLVTLVSLELAGLALTDGGGGSVVQPFVVLLPLLEAVGLGCFVGLPLELESASEALDLADLVGDETSGAPGLEDLVGDETSGAPGLADLVGDKTSGALGLEDLVGDETSGALGLEDLVGDETSGEPGLEDLVGDETSGAPGLEDLVGDETSGALGLEEDLVGDVSSGAPGLDDLVGDDVTSAALGLDPLMGDATSGAAAVCLTLLVAPAGDVGSRLLDRDRTMGADVPVAISLSAVSSLLLVPWLLLLLLLLILDEVDGGGGRRFGPGLRLRATGLLLLFGLTLVLFVALLWLLLFGRSLSLSLSEEELLEESSLSFISLGSTSGKLVQSAPLP